MKPANSLSAARRLKCFPERLDDPLRKIRRDIFLIREPAVHDRPYQHIHREFGIDIPVSSPLADACFSKRAICARRGAKV